MSIGIMSGILDGLIHSSGILATFGISAATAATIAAGATVAGAAASAYGAHQAGKAAKKGGGGVPQPTDIFAQTGSGTNLLESQASGLQNYFQTQGPGLAALSRSAMKSLSPEQSQLTAMGLWQAKEAQQQSELFGDTAKRAMSRYGSRVGSYSPTLSGISGYTEVTTPEEQAKALYDTQMAQTMAQEAFARRGILSSEEQRAAQQRAREASSASGRIGGNAGIAAEIMNREAAMAGRRGEASQLGQVAYGQGIGALQQRLATQQARYQQLGSERDREISRLQNLFTQGLAAGQLNLQERQLGFGQMMDIEQQKARVAEQARAATLGAFGMANTFYTTPGLSMLNLPISLAQQTAGQQTQAGIANYQINAANQQANAQMWGGIGSSLMGGGLSALGSYGSGAGAGAGAGAGSTYTQSGSSPWGKVNYSYV